MRCYTEIWLRKTLVFRSCFAKFYLLDCQLSQFNTNHTLLKFLVKLVANQKPVYICMFSLAGANFGPCRLLVFHVVLDDDEVGGPSGRGLSMQRVHHPKPADVLMPGAFHRREAFGLCYERKAYRGLAEGSFLLPVCGCPWELVPIWRPRRDKMGQQEKSAVLKDLATSGAARVVENPHMQ